MKMKNCVVAETLPNYGKNDTNEKRLFSSHLQDGSIWLEVCCDKISPTVAAQSSSVMTTSDVHSAFLGQGIKRPLQGCPSAHMPTWIKEYLHDFLCFLNLILETRSDSICAAKAEISQRGLLNPTTRTGSAAAQPNSTLWHFFFCKRRTSLNTKINYLPRKDPHTCVNILKLGWTAHCR